MTMQALVMGFGGTGAHILTYLKEMTYIKHGEVPDNIKFLYMDTIAGWNPGSSQQIEGGKAKEEFAKGREISLDPSTEYFYLKDRAPDLKRYIFNYLTVYGQQQRVSHLKNWLHAYWFSDPDNIPRAALDISQGAAQQRQIGRFAMFQNAQQIVNLMSAKIQELDRYAGQDAVNVWIVGSSAGGTGAGCMIDAAYMARLAAGNRYANKDIRVNGIVVFPNVYTDKSGIIAARAYSMFRDLERMQGVGMGDKENKYKDYVVGGDIISRVDYDAHGTNYSSVDSKLFDYLFYLGSKCQTDAERTRFFSSVASGVDPYLDGESGKDLLQESVNKNGAASSFGAARLYIPKNTLIDIFAWEQAKEFLEALTAPRRKGNHFENVYYGDVAERHEEACRKVDNLLEFFKYLRKQKGKTDEVLQPIVEQRIDPETIIKEFYQLETLGLSPADKQVAKLPIVNPYISFSEENEQDVASRDIEVKTAKEHRAAKMPSEKADASRDRFHEELLSITDEYTKAEGGKRSFERGRKEVFRIISQALMGRVDKRVIEGAFETSESLFRDPHNAHMGTPMTRLYAELGYILSDKGPLMEIETTIDRLISLLRNQESVYDQKKTDTLNALEKFRSKFWGPSVDDFQQTARAELTEYIRWYQKLGLLGDMKNIIGQVKDRFRKWHGIFQTIVDKLLLGNDSALYLTQNNLDRLETRLTLMAQNPTSMIGIKPGDASMHGFRDHLKEIGVLKGDKSLVDEIKDSSQWEPVIDGDSIRIQFQFSVPDHPAESFSHDNIANIHDVLHLQFKEIIRSRLKDQDIFDYLLYLQNESVSLDQVVNKMNQMAKPLISANKTDDARLIFRNPEKPEKLNLSQVIETQLRGIGEAGNVKSSMTTHSDETSLSIVKVRAPNISQIVDLENCRNDYLRLQLEDIIRVPSEDEVLRRAQVFHPFRPELEAWHIERNYSKKVVKEALNEEELIRPRIARLLENPAMTQAFVHCIATGALEKVEKEWIWHNTREKLKLNVTSKKIDTNPTLLRAAVVFILQQREGTVSGLNPITLDDARQSAVDMAQQQGKTPDDAVKEFIDEKLDDYLNEFFPLKGDPVAHELEKQSLNMIFRFYANPDVGTELKDRQEL